MSDDLDITNYGYYKIIDEDRKWIIFKSYPYKSWEKLRQEFMDWRKIPDWRRQTAPAPIIKQVPIIKGGWPKTKKAMEDAILKIVQELPQEIIDRVIMNFSNRMRWFHAAGSKIIEHLMQ